MTTNNYQSQTESYVNRAACLDFNNGYCSFIHCKFTHACSNCGGTNHGRQTCFKLTSPNVNRGDLPFVDQEASILMPVEQDLSRGVATGSSDCAAEIQPSVSNKNHLDPALFSLAKTPISLENLRRELIRPLQSLTGFHLISYCIILGPMFLPIPKI